MTNPKAFTAVAAEWQMYLPLAAIVAPAVVGGCWLLRRAGTAYPPWKLFNRWAAMAAVIVALMTGAFGIAKGSRLAAYRDPLVLCHGTLASQPDNCVAPISMAEKALELARAQGLANLAQRLGKWLTSDRLQQKGSPGRATPSETVGASP